MSTHSKAKKTKQYTNQNILEAFKSIGTGIVDSATKDVARDSFTKAWEQMLGADGKHSENHSGELQEGHEIDLKKHGKNEKREHAAPAMNYHHEIVEAEKRGTKETQREIQLQIQEVLIELKKISETSKEIAIEFKEVTIEQRIEKPGEYHLNFFSWMLAVVRDARKRIEDSGAWLNTMKSKKGQKNYWAMFKKHGTSFGLSNERVVATQVG